jgi:hypothetical protein
VASVLQESRGLAMGLHGRSAGFRDWSVPEVMAHIGRSLRVIHEMNINGREIAGWRLGT